MDETKQNDQIENPELRRAQRIADQRALQSWWERNVQRASEWDLETVKHLVVLNVAGVAGVTTLVAGSDQITPRWLAVTALSGYGLGVILAVLNMHLAARGFDLYAGEIRDRIQTLLPKDGPREELFNKVTRGKTPNVLGQIAGWISAALAVASTVAVGIGVFR
ncbi:hypothetical protein [Pandoraea apista]|uniref:hypothetical protein n=1 Tax=Pandoraea apista TaxID=93218 RepID=UPI002F92DFD0